MNDYWFFLSYARRDNKDEGYVKHFFQQLAGEVGKAVGLPSNVPEDDIGFFDVMDIEPGKDWQETISEALRISRVMVCVYSPAYFNSEYCGKELQVFYSRVRDYRDAKSIPWPALILPVLWEHPDRLPKPLPAPILNIQFKHEDFGAKYAQEGMRYLNPNRLNQDRTGWDNFISKFADFLVDAAKKYPLPTLPNVPPLAQVKSLFQTAPIGSLTAVTTPKNVGPRAARLIFVAGNKNDLQGIKQNTDFYGDDGGPDWQPYLPHTTKQVGSIVQGAVAEKDLISSILPIDENLINQIRSAEQTNTIVLIVIDPWSIQTTAYQERMMEYDQAAFINCGILIPWNDHDGETAQQAQQLHDTLNNVLKRNYILNISYIRDSIRSAEELHQELIKAIGEIRRRLMKSAPVPRRISGPGSTTVPTIISTAPGGAQ